MDMGHESAQTEAVTKRDILVGIPEIFFPGKIDGGVAAHSNRHQVRFEIEEVSNETVVWWFIWSTARPILIYQKEKVDVVGRDCEPDSRPRLTCTVPKIDDFTVPVSMRLMAIHVSVFSIQKISEHTAEVLLSIDSATYYFLILLQLISQIRETNTELLRPGTRQFVLTHYCSRYIAAWIQLRERTLFLPRQDPPTESRWGAVISEPPLRPTHRMNLWVFVGTVILLGYLEGSRALMLTQSCLQIGLWWWFYIFALLPWVSV